MKRVRLIHWNATEAEERAQTLRAAGFEVDARPLTHKEEPPEAFVIDLSRLPMQGRDVGMMFRQRKPTRHVPLVFVEGDPEKVARIRQFLPDAVYTDWSRVAGALKQAIANPPAEVVVPKSVLEGYSGTPLPKKLGVRSTVAVINAPEGFEATIDAAAAPPGKADLLVWFVTSRKELERRIARMATLTPAGGMWIAWPKKASGVSSDLTQADVREIGLAAGLVDYKVCAIDATWSGLKFARRKH